NGVLERRGHTEAAYDLALLAGVTPAVVLSELMHPDGTMMRTPAIREFCAEHDLALLSVEDIVCWRRRRPRVIERATAEVEMAGGTAKVTAFENESGEVHAVTVVGDPGNSITPPLVRVHSECLT